MNRAGVEPGEPTLKLAQAIAAYPGLDLRGLMSWEGHTLGFEDDGEKRSAITVLRIAGYVTITDPISK